MFYKVSSVCGAGKTTSAIKWAISEARSGRKIAIVQPTTRLIDQTYGDIRGIVEQGERIAVHRFHHDVQEGRVQDAILGHLRHASPHGEVILLTQEAFLRLPYWHRRDLWTVIVDEVPQVDRHFPFRLSVNHRYLTDHLAVEDFDALHYRLRPGNRQQIENYRDNRQRDDVLALFKGVADLVIGEHWSVYVRKEQWHRHLDDATENGQHGLDIFALLEPSVFEGFAEVILMAAMFEESLLYIYWTNQGVEFIDHESITAGLRYHEHQNGNLVEFLYLFEEDWSKRLRNQIVEGKSVFEWSVRAIMDRFAGKPFAWAANADIQDINEFTGHPRIPTSPHGLNDFQHIDNVVFLPALNRAPAHFAFLSARGLDAESVKFATGCQFAYQSFMRSSARDPMSKTRKTCVVPDQRTAEFLAQVFPGCSIGPTGGQVKVTKKPSGRPSRSDSLTSAEKKRRERAARRRQILEDLLALPGEENVTETPLSNSLLVTKKNMPKEPRSGEREQTDPAKSWGQFSVDLYDSIYSVEPLMRLKMTNEELIGALRLCHEVSTKSKTSNLLISSSEFDPKKSPETKRGKANINHVNGIWLDNDGGDLHPEEFHRLFPDLRLVAFNTYTGGNRWRGFIPTTQVMTVEAHEIIIQSIEKTLNQAGYWSTKQVERRGHGRCHGFDTSKFNAASLFYLPVQAQGGEGNSYFLDLPGRELDPVLWIKNAVLHDPLDVRPVLEFEDHDGRQDARNSKIEINDLLARIAQGGRPAYDDWIKVTWATIRCLDGDRDAAIDLMKRFFPEERSGEYDVLAKGWTASRSPGWRFLNSLAW
ncbi:MAG: hypothetical protein VR70_05300 [Rhodospirillaceae bacterium BRH_c57]|nr:MAG: hypothetical protein VR70_05300 [Rhodospirillaceae bacterium BRH_c57]